MFLSLGQVLEGVVDEVDKACSGKTGDRVLADAVGLGRGILDNEMEAVGYTAVAGSRGESLEEGMKPSEGQCPGPLGRCWFFHEPQRPAASMATWAGSEVEGEQIAGRAGLPSWPGVILHGLKKDSARDHAPSGAAEELAAEIGVAQPSESVVVVVEAR